MHFSHGTSRSNPKSQLPRLPRGSLVSPSPDAQHSGDQSESPTGACDVCGCHVRHMRSHASPWKPVWHLTLRTNTEWCKVTYNSPRYHESLNLYMLHYPPPAQTCSKQGATAWKPLTTWQVNPKHWGHQKRTNLTNTYTIYTNNSNQCHSNGAIRDPRTDATSPFLPFVPRRGGSEVKGHPPQPPLPDTYMVRDNCQ